MKKVLFIGLTYYKLQEGKEDSHLRKKFEELSKSIKPFVLARGEVFHQKIWGTDFYLLEPDIFFWPSAFFTAFYICLKENIDVIVTETPLVDGFVGTIIAKALGKELVVEIHGDWEEAPFLVKKRSFAGFKKKIVPLLARFSLRSADKIRAISGFTKKKAKEVVGNKKSIFVFPAFSDLDIFFEEQDVSFEDFILFVGVLEKVKGIKYLVEAFSKIHDKFPKFSLKIVGEGSQKERLRGLANQYGIDSKTDFTGRLPLGETKDITKRCYCLVLPSVSEGLGRVLIEAAALGKPLVG
ncbi:MAG: glycosyltransferase, partial [Candidatus Nealsonbacteria bacterium]|nr:glycosyltransferase [Candidatus Nealsonbacteria bacterium]